MDEFTKDVAVEVTTKLIKDALSSLYDPIAGFLRVQKAQFIDDFSSYCGLVHSKCSLVRTLYSKNKPVHLSEAYVRTRFSQEGDQFTDDDLVRKFSSGDRIVVKGNGGSGKTIFLKHLWLSRFQKQDGRIPVFVELRRLNDLQSIDLMAFCRNELNADASFGKGVFEKLCEAGKFEFIFDGFDEVNRESRISVERQILSLSEKYRKCSFLVSGREDDRFTSWGSFEIFSVSPLSLDNVKELIEKIPFDRKVKKKFIATLEPDFYDKHYSFLSSPLLAVMMLMTFNENATIPSKLTEFYKSAFQTLLTWHDATKDSFERERSLSVDQFRKVFSTFCLITYYEQLVEFDEELFRRYIEKALKYHSIDVDIDGAKNDICESANLLQKDGLNYIFVHRSFQEYFAAECAMQVVSGKAKEFLDVFSRRPFDSVFSMCYEIHPELVYDRYFADKVREALLSPYFVPAGRERQANTWLCNCLLIDCVNTSDYGISVSRGKYEQSEEQQDFLRLVQLCGQATGTETGIEQWRLPIHELFDAAVRSVDAARDAKVLPRGELQSLRLKLSFEGEKFSLSIRNTGEKKFSPSDMKKFRSKVSSVLTDEMKKYRKSLAQFYNRSEAMFKQLVQEREAKERSIDDILAI